MSIDIQWETLTKGQDGARLEENVRAFIHDKFQQVTLPRFIRSVQVHSFHFGTIPPEVELKDICDPLPDFYSEDDDVAANGNENAVKDIVSVEAVEGQSAREQNYDGNTRDIPCESSKSVRPEIPTPVDVASPGISNLHIQTSRPTSTYFPTSQTPGIPGGTSNLAYFHLPFGSGLSGATTPLAAVAGAHFHGGWLENSGNLKHLRSLPMNQQRPPSISGSPALSPSADTAPGLQSPYSKGPRSALSGEKTSEVPSEEAPEQDSNDIQVVAHVKYSGDLRLSLTAEILLDYPMPSFVGIPLQLNITGLAFDGVAIVAHIKNRAHVCFLSPEDAEAFADHPTNYEEGTQGADGRNGKVGGLLEEIKVESEIGQREDGKQVLKNVGKVEKFVLEQVRRIFEDEFVYPSFWTFLV